MKPLVCPACKRLASRAIYMGFPVKVCLECLPSRGSTVWGFWSLLMQVLPFNGWFFVYEGSYPEALWAWMTRDGGSDEDDYSDF